MSRWKGAAAPPPTEITKCKEAFCLHDSGTGSLPLRLVRSALQRLGIFPSEEELFELIAKYDPDGIGALKLQQFIDVVSDHKGKADARTPADTTTIDAFVALGGNRDQSGVISTEKLREAVRIDFALPINIDKLIREADSDGSGFIDFDEFTAMLRQAEDN